MYGTSLIIAPLFFYSTKWNMNTFDLEYEIGWYKYDCVWLYGLDDDWRDSNNKNYD